MGDVQGLPTWSCFPQMTCVGALILLMFSWRECLDFSSTISKNTSGTRGESVLQGNVWPSCLKGGQVVLRVSPHWETQAEMMGCPCPATKPSCRGALSQTISS